MTNSPPDNSGRTARSPGCSCTAIGAALLLALVALAFLLSGLQDYGSNGSQGGAGLAIGIFVFLCAGTAAALLLVAIFKR